MTALHGPDVDFGPHESTKDTLNLSLVVICAASFTCFTCSVWQYPSIFTHRSVALILCRLWTAPHRPKDYLEHALCASFEKQICSSLKKKTGKIREKEVIRHFTYPQDKTTCKYNAIHKPHCE